MSAYLLDTNTISEIRKGDRGNAGVKQWAQETADSGWYLSVLTLGEIRQGVERLRKKDLAQCIALERWLGHVEFVFAKYLLPVSAPIADVWGRWRSVRPLPPVDTLLAATAKVHDLTLVTRNTADLKGLDVRVINPFS